MPSTLLIALRRVASMTIKDEVDNKSRWATLQRVLAASRDQLDRLRDEFNVNVVLARFAEEVSDYDPDGKADGQRTDFGRMLHTLHQRYSGERRLRGLLVLSDGADNGTLYPALRRGGPVARARLPGVHIRAGPGDDQHRPAGHCHHQPDAGAIAGAGQGKADRPRRRSTPMGSRTARCNCTCSSTIRK